MNHGKMNVSDHVIVAVCLVCFQRISHLHNDPSLRRSSEIDLYLPGWRAAAPSLKLHGGAWPLQLQPITAAAAALTLTLAQLQL